MISKQTMSMSTDRHPCRCRVVACRPNADICLSLDE